MTADEMNKPNTAAKRQILSSLQYSMGRDRTAMLGLGMARSINKRCVKSELSGEIIQQALGDMYKYFEERVADHEEQVLELLK